MYVCSYEYALKYVFVWACIYMHARFTSAGSAASFVLRLWEGAVDAIPMWVKLHTSGIVPWSSHHFLLSKANLPMLGWICRQFQHVRTADAGIDCVATYSLEEFVIIKASRKNHVGP